MPKSTINLGSSPNDGTGSNLRTGGTIVNNNFNEIYTNFGDGTNLKPYIDFADDSSTVLRANIGQPFTIEGGLGIDTAVSSGKFQIKVNASVLTANASATLTNKTINLANNTISGTLSEFNTALSGTSFVSTDGSETLTNKSINSSLNSITNIANSSLVNSGITIRDNTSTTDVVNLGETLSIIGTGSVSSTVTGNTVTLNVSNLTNSDLSGTAGISNANLANSTVQIGGSSVSLGQSLAAASNFNLTGTSSLSGSGTIDQTGSGSKVRHNFSNFASLPDYSNYSGMFGLEETNLVPYVASTSGWIRILTENDSVSRHTDVTLTGIADGYILKWNSGNSRFEPNAESGGSSLTIQDEGSGLSTAATTLNFTGSGVTASGSGATKTINIPGGSGSSLTVQDEGSALSTDATTLNFVGAGVVASGTGATKTITIAGGGASALDDLSDVTNSSPVAGHTLVYDGSGWVQATTPVSQLLVTSSGSSGYRFTGAGFPSTSGNNPDLHLKKGQTYYFINNSGGSHPFRIQSTTGTGGTAYNTGVTNNNSASGAIIFHVSMDTPATLYYQCTNHGAMNGTINIT